MYFQIRASAAWDIIYFSESDTANNYYTHVFSSRDGKSWTDVGLLPGDSALEGKTLILHEKCQPIYAFYHVYRVEKFVTKNGRIKEETADLKAMMRDKEY